MRISDWSSDVCSSDLLALVADDGAGAWPLHAADGVRATRSPRLRADAVSGAARRSAREQARRRSEERRGGKECVSKCRYRGSPDHTKKTTTVRQKGGQYATLQVAHISVQKHQP